MNWSLILNAILKELEAHPDRVFSILEDIIGLLKANPAAVANLIAAFAPKQVAK